MKRLLTVWLALFLMLAAVFPATAGAAQRTPAPWPADRQHDWYTAYDVTVSRTKGTPVTTTGTFTVKANAARLTVINDGMTGLDLAVNGQKLHVKAGAYDISPWLTYGENELAVTPQGKPGATATLRVAAPAYNARITHINDIHAKIDQLPRVAAYVNSARAATDGDFYFINAGDNFSGGPVSDLNKGLPMIEILNAMGTDLMAVGNHEFDHGPAATRQRQLDANFPWLSANTVVTDSSLTPITGFAPYQIFANSLGQRIAFVGLTETPPSTALKNQVGLTFTSPTVAAQQQIAALRDQVNVIVLVSHNGINYDRQMATAVAGADLIIGAHSHTYLPEPVVVSGIPIVQVGSDGRWVGDLQIRQAEAFTLTGAAPDGLHTIAVANLTAEDAAVRAIVDRWNTEMADDLDAVLGVAQQNLSNRDRYLYDVGLGNLITDAMREAMGTEVAFTNNGGIRASINAGEITMREVYTVLPFGNFIVKMNLTGAQLQQALEYSYARRNSLDLQTSGLTYRVYTKPGSAELDHMEIAVGGAPLDPARTYSVALQDFLATGGSGYPFPQFGAPVDQAASVDAILVAEFIRLIGNVDYPDHTGRIQVIEL